MKALRYVGKNPTSNIIFFGNFQFMKDKDVSKLKKKICLKSLIFINNRDNKSLAIDLIHHQKGKQKGCFVSWKRVLIKLFRD